MRRILLLVVCVWGLLSGAWAFAREAAGPEEPRLTVLHQWKVKNGDDPGWALPGSDDSGWESLAVRNGWNRRGIFWLRRVLEIARPPEESDPLTLSVYNLPAAFEVYWDGVLIGSNGRPGATSADERAGAVRYTRILGESRSQPGRHVLALRVSNQQVRRAMIVTGISFGPLAELDGIISRSLDDRLVSLGLYFIAGLFSAFLFLRGRKNPAFLLFSGFNLIFFAYCAWIYSVESLGTSILVFAWVEPLVVFGSSLGFVLLNAFILWHFEVRRPVLHLTLQTAAALGAAALAGPLEARLAAFEAVIIFWGLGMTVVLAARRKRGSGLALAAMGILAGYHLPILVSASILRFMHSLPGFFDMLITGAFLAFITGVIAIRIRDENCSLQVLELRARRLESDLLKKCIQPHFIMNTLVSIQSWFGRDPAKAGRLIEALAEEFRIISRIASQPEIDAAEEIDLCRSHLELMGFRRDAAYKLDLAGDFSGLKVPPMLFHTLIENGLTHAFEARENGLFRLECIRSDGAVEYRLANDGSRLAWIAGEASPKSEEGMGLKYVRTRLEESYPGRWEMAYGFEDGLWRVRVTIRKAGSR